MEIAAENGRHEAAAAQLKRQSLSLIEPVGKVFAAGRFDGWLGWGAGWLVGRSPLYPFTLSYMPLHIFINYSMPSPLRRSNQPFATPPPPATTPNTHLLSRCGGPTMLYLFKHYCGTGGQKSGPSELEMILK